jgi:DNA-directed RNA polymerase sigma subunit (sigma70/sigma32)
VIFRDADHVLSSTGFLNSFNRSTASERGVITEAWQSWQPSRPRNNRSSPNNFDGRSPSQIRYLDEEHLTYDPNQFDYGSSSDQSDDVIFDSRGKKRRKVHAKIKTDVMKNLSFHNYPSHIAQPVPEPESTRQQRRRSRLAPRSTNGSAILPTKRNANAKVADAQSNLLSLEEETEIAYQIKHFRAVMRVKDQLVDWMSKEVNHRYMGQAYEPSDEQWASACSLSVFELHEVLARGQEARTKIITGNVGLVTMIAKRYHNLLQGSSNAQVGTDATLKLEDLIQEGYIGIMDAAERFDPEKGFRFSTYGSHWVRQRILRSISESSRIIRLPVHVQTMVS